MKLGKDIAIAVADIPDVYIQRVLSVVDAIEKKQVEAMLNAEPKDLLPLQKSVQTLRQLRKAVESAPEEAKLYK
tara:strand:+ start:331 stop:552 length:222 start_codon:yes stop_codon:yes gene_type:complete